MGNKQVYDIKYFYRRLLAVHSYNVVINFTKIEIPTKTTYVAVKEVKAVVKKVNN